MSIRQISLVLQLPPRRRSRVEFEMLIYLADRADDDGGNVFPDQVRLAKATGRTKRKVYETLLQLRKRGWLRSDQVEGKSRWRLQISLGSTKKRYTSVPLFGTPSNAPTHHATNHLGVGTDRPPSFDPSLRTKDEYSGCAAPRTTRLKNRPTSHLSRLPAEDGNYRVAVKAAHVLINYAGTADPDDPELVEAFKITLAKLRIVYNSELVACALRDACGARRSHAAR